MLTDVKAMMGHADISTTMISVHHVPQIDAAARLSALLGTNHELPAAEANAHRPSEPVEFDDSPSPDTVA